MYVPALECPSAYVTLVQNMTWSNNEDTAQLASIWGISSRAEDFVSIDPNNAVPERPLVQLNTNTLVVRFLCFVNINYEYSANT